MKINYTNIFLFSLSLNIWSLSSDIYNQRNHILTLHNPTIASRLLCECKLYAPSNYDNDPEMKAVMQNFDRQTSQRFEEYNESMIKNRQKCKEQCEKDIQQIILKDKIEKELTVKLSTLQTDISTNDIPTCVCEKSVADKVEKTCLKCGVLLGGGIAPGWSLVSGIVYTGWKAAALAAAKKAAIAEGLAVGKIAGDDAGVKALIYGLSDKFLLETLQGKLLNDIITTEVFRNPTFLSAAIKAEQTRLCWNPEIETNKLFCSLGEDKTEPNWFVKYVETNLEKVVGDATKAAEQAAESTTESVTEAAIETNSGAVEVIYMGYHNVIIASVVAILVIVLVMVIIYLILRYRRKKKMKKKLHYIKLLKE
ncbi:PIR protein, putative [Plasmodium sp. gorilla clade G1]|nr:PIR protein, putative [Plasmodium sp. gorilla clade G1]